MLREITLGLEGEGAVTARVRSEIGVRSDVFLKHGWLLAADAALLAHILSATPSSYVSVVLIRLETTCN